jgi:hypothetical protein
MILSRIWELPFRKKKKFNKFSLHFIIRLKNQKSLFLHHYPYEFSTEILPVKFCYHVENSMGNAQIKEEDLNDSQKRSIQEAVKIDLNNFFSHLGKLWSWRSFLLDKLRKMMTERVNLKQDIISRTLCLRSSSSENIFIEKTMHPNTGEKYSQIQNF